MVLLLVGIFMAMAFYEVTILSREKLWRELAAFSLLWIMALGLSLLLTLGVPLPSPTDGIVYIINKTGELFK
ncbi:MAG: hypothetical protein ACOY9Y_14760 [Bacillota bacterium]